MLDTLKIAASSTGGIWITYLEAVPIVVRVMVGLATFAYILVKTKKLLEE